MARAETETVHGEGIGEGGGQPRSWLGNNWNTMAMPGADLSGEECLSGWVGCNMQLYLKYA